MYNSTKVVYFRQSIKMKLLQSANLIVQILFIFEFHERADSLVSEWADSLVSEWADSLVVGGIDYNSECTNAIRKTMINCTTISY